MHLEDEVALAKAKGAALQNARYTAYSSDVGEAFRPMVPDWAVGLFLSAHLWNLGFRCGVSANVHVETSLHSPPPVAYKPTDVLAVVAPFQRAFLGVAPPELRVPGFAQKGISPLAHNQALEMSLRYGDAERIDNLSLED